MCICTPPFLRRDTKNLGADRSVLLREHIPSKTVTLGLNFILPRKLLLALVTETRFGSNFSSPPGYIDVESHIFAIHLVLRLTSEHLLSSHNGGREPGCFGFGSVDLSAPHPLPVNRLPVTSSRAPRLLSDGGCWEPGLLF